MNISSSEIIDFWYSDRIKSQWFASTPALDQEIYDQYGALWESAYLGNLDAWAKEVEGSLALVIVLDQFPLNMFRGQAKSFQSERKSVEIAQNTINQKFDQVIEKERLAFLYMPFMHSENLAEQDLSVKLFRGANLEGNIKFAEHHRDIVRKFGRFPHRNAILGRVSTPEETEYLASKGAFKG